jgi:hypothetical protein
MPATGLQALNVNLDGFGVYGYHSCITKGIVRKINWLKRKRFNSFNGS